MVMKLNLRSCYYANAITKLRTTPSSMTKKDRNKINPPTHTTCILHTHKTQKPWTKSNKKTTTTKREIPFHFLYMLSN